jgi:hypothetical protein
MDGNGVNQELGTLNPVTGVRSAKIYFPDSCSVSSAERNASFLTHRQPKEVSSVIGGEACRDFGSLM